MPKKKEKVEHNSQWLIELYQINYLAHSYIYYHFNNNVISDSEYDSTCNRLIDLMKDAPKLAKSSKYYKICKGLDESASGFSINKEDYPQEIVDIAIRLLKQNDKWSDEHGKLR